VLDNNVCVYNTYPTGTPTAAQVTVDYS